MLIAVVCSRSLGLSHNADYFIVRRGMVTLKYAEFFEAEVALGRGAGVGLCRHVRGGRRPGEVER